MIDILFPWLSHLTVEKVFFFFLSHISHTRTGGL